MPTTQHATKNATVLDAVRRLVDEGDRRSHELRASAIVRVVAMQKAANAVDGIQTEPEDNWALLLSAIDRGAL